MLEWEEYECESKTVKAVITTDENIVEAVDYGLNHNPTMFDPGSNKGTYYFAERPYRSGSVIIDDGSKVYAMQRVQFRLLYCLASMTDEDKNIWKNVLPEILKRQYDSQHAVDQLKAMSPNGL